MKKYFAMALAIILCIPTFAQKPVNFTTEQDFQNMLDQLGIKSVRRGFDADQSSPFSANYDESIANPYPVLPELMKTNKGKKVKSAKDWWNVRRPEIKEGFESEIYGRVPENVPEVKWELVVEEIERVGMIPAKAKQLVGRVDNSACPEISVNIKMVVVTPANAKGPVPLLMMFGQANLPNPVTPDRNDMEVINRVIRKMLEDNPETADLMKKYPAWQPFEAANPFAMFSRAQLAPGQDPPSNQQLLAAGWGYAMIDPSSIQADNGAGLTRGIIGLVNKGQPRKPDDWGSLRAWAWGAARGLDYLETDPDVDAKHVGIEGVSRYGKAALVTLAFEERFAMGLIGSSGKGGATLHRRYFGEGLENLATSGEYHWMAGNYIKYNAVEPKKGNADMLPVDSHCLIAMCAPRLVFISYGIPEQGDALWLDQYGSWQATVAAGEAFTLLGSTDLGLGNDYRSVPMPAVNEDVLNGNLAWRQHDGGHTDAPNMKHFIKWATAKIGYVFNK
ncbi:MAG: acetylxylan esterase [Bacteroidales bacterium]|nr:acetylxylan esterase [Bacteroidales bacterium]